MRDQKYIFTVTYSLSLEAKNFIISILILPAPVYPQSGPPWRQ